MRFSIRPGRPPRATTTGLVLLVMAAAVVALGIGRYGIPLTRVVGIILAPIVPPVEPVGATEANVVFTIRLPRILLALMSGASLSLAGATLQGVFRNPLIGPQVIGVSSGAAFGGTLAILLGATHVGLLGSAFACGVAAIVLVYALNDVIARRNILALVLAGVVINGFFTALVSLVQYVADSEDTLPTIVFWLMGSFATASWDKLNLVAVPMLAGCGLLLALRWRINILSLGDEEARALGIKVERLRWFVLVLVAVVVAAQVAVSGIIGWIGLVVPHMARILVGPDHRSLMPASLLIGALFLLIIDTVARTLTATEIPLGILTALIGAPVFALLLRKTERGGHDG
ncbi:FecCD family ABC transporter permease [Pleomorphomonas sp. PLEO]|uniref:FecCD family ABC transporter permease n=1 Tax=Pleomorphomonas sp. PLEO TaxID=3239306 RepID=UPI00351F15A4